MDVGLTTNGPTLPDTVLDDCQWIRISLDAADSTTYSKRKGTLSQHFDTVLENVQRLVKQKSQRGSDCTIGLAYLTRDETVEQLRKFVLLAKKLGVDYAQFRPYHDTTSDLSPRIEQTKELETATFKVSYPKDKYQRKKQDYGRCFGDEFRVVVSATGDMYPDCFTRGMENFSYGNLLTQSFEEIWHSKKRQEIFSTKLEHPNCPHLSKTDTLNVLLWELYQRKEVDSNTVSQQAFQHANFV